MFRKVTNRAVSKTTLHAICVCLSLRRHKSWGGGVVGYFYRVPFKLASSFLCKFFTITCSVILPTHRAHLPTRVSQCDKKVIGYLRERGNIMFPCIAGCTPVQEREICTRLLEWFRDLFKQCSLAKEDT